MIPLAERMRPKTLDQLTGQEHLVGPDSILRKALESGHLPSMILWGPPGVGKTTLAKILATLSNRPYFTLSAISGRLFHKLQLKDFLIHPPPFYLSMKSIVLIKVSKMHSLVL